MKRIGLEIGLLAGVVLLSAQANAQTPAPAAAPPPAAAAPPPAAPPPAETGARTHDGFFFRLGLNAGPLLATAKSELNGTQVGEDAKYSGLTFGYDMLIGGSPIPGLAIGGALIGTTTSDPNIKAGNLEQKADGTMLLAGVAAFADFYFDPHSGGHVQALFGFAALDFVAASGASGGNDPTGLMLGLGGGYDFWLGDEWSIGPFARILYAPVSSDAGGGSLKVSYLYPSIGVAFTLH